MEVLQGIDLTSIKTAKGGDRVYKDECIYSFETPVNIGLCINVCDYQQQQTGMMPTTCTLAQSMLPCEF